MNKFAYEESSKHKYLELKDKNSLDLYLAYCGVEKCNPSHSYGPAIRSDYLIHFILEGEGTYYVNGQEFVLGKNQGFLAFPNQLIHYEASKTNPWKYIWIAFNGIKAKEYLNYINLDENNVIYDYQKDSSLEEYVIRMLELNKFSYANKLELQGLLYLFLSKLANQINSNKKNNNSETVDLYIEKSIEYIQNNYFKKSLKITDLASFIGLNRSYLSNLFKKSLNISPQEFLLNYRIEQASNLLKTTNLPISSIATSVGYKDPLTFSKLFKKVKGSNPTDYRKNNA